MGRVGQKKKKKGQNQLAKLKEIGQLDSKLTGWVSGRLIRACKEYWPSQLTNHNLTWVTTWQAYHNVKVKTRQTKLDFSVNAACTKTHACVSRACARQKASRCLHASPYALNFYQIPRTPTPQQTHNLPKSMGTFVFITFPTSANHVEISTKSPCK